MVAKKMLWIPLLFVVGLAGVKLFAHCQIPCGIFDDPTRFALMREHVTTLAKSMDQIMELEKAAPANYNQITRWVMNKEEHADDFTQIVTYYFMAQRIKPTTPENKEAYDKYIREVTLLHEMIVNAMKVKQTTDKQYIDKLNGLIDRFEISYLGEEKAHGHGHDHAGDHRH